MPRALVALAALAAALLALLVLVTGPPGSRAAAPPEGAAGEAWVAERVDSLDSVPALGTAVGAPAAAGPARTPVAVPPAEERAPLATSAARPRLLGRVARAGGAPLPGASVELSFHHRAAGVDAKATVEADAEGRFALELAGPCTLGAAVVAATADTPSAAARFDRALLPGRTESIEVLVGSGGTLRGRVVDQAGRAVAGAEVVAWLRDPLDVDAATPPDRRTTAAAGGSFVLEGLGQRFVVSASAPGLAPARTLAGEIPDGEEVRGLELVVAPARALHGRVVDEHGAPIADQAVGVGTRSWSFGEPTASAHVRATEPLGLDVVTGADGTFRAEPLAEKAWQVLVRRPGYRAISRYLRPSEEPVELVLARGATLSGRVLGCDGAPAAGARVLLRGAGGADVTTDAEGRFAASGFEPGGEARVHVHLPGCAIHVEQPVAIAESGETHVEIALAPGRAIAGRVVDPEGRPVAYAPVRVEGERVAQPDVDMLPKPTWEWSLGLEETRASEGGAFRFEDLYDGQLEVTATDPLDRDLHVTATVRSGEEQLVLVLDPVAARRVALVGRVVDALTGAPVRSFRLTAMYGDVGFPREFRDAGGRFELVGLEPGEIAVHAGAEGYAPARLPAREYVAGDHSLDVELYPARSLEVRVVDETGAGMLANVSVEYPDGRTVPIVAGALQSSYQIVPPEGATLNGLPARPLVVVAEGYELARPTRAPADLTSAHSGVFLVGALRADPVWIDVRFVSESAAAGGLALAEVEATLVAADGRSLSDASGHLREDGSWVTRTSWLGSTTGKIAEPGTLRLRVPHPDLLAEPLTLVVEAPGHARIERRLEEMRGPEPAVVVRLRRETR